MKVVKLDELVAEEKVRLINRCMLDFSSIEHEVADIINRVRERGDAEIVDFYRRFFGQEVLTKEKIKISSEEIKNAYEHVPERLIEALKVSAENIEKFHRSQLPPQLFINEIRRGLYAGRVVKPLDSVGIYVPGGRASYPSTALMAAIPAKVAGVPRILACTPPREDGTVEPAILVALDIAGAKEVYRVGGVHAAAAMAFGTETIPKVLKIVGPGGAWFTAAKLLLMTFVSIDMIAGPSEILIIADGSADPEFLAWDLAAQAEHDLAASPLLLTNSKKLAEEVSRTLDMVVESSPRKNIIKESLNRNGVIILVNDLDEAFEFANEYAAEHVEVIADMSMVEVLSKLRNAGSISIGPCTPVALEDYVAGPNHILPTSGWAKTRGGLSVHDYLKLVSVLLAEKDGLEELGRFAVEMAEAEGLYAHAGSIAVRLKRNA
ncbi:MAG: histidinol dehydrogenase [Nitrososphaerota archaeon]